MRSSSDDKLWAMLAHLLTLLGFVTPPFGFFVPPLVIYLMKKDQSSFVAFHALQSVYWQLLVLGLLIFMGVVAFVIGVLTLGLGFIVIAPIVGVIPTLNAIYAIVAGIKAYAGDAFEYYFVGPIARRSTGTLNTA